MAFNDEPVVVILRTWIRRANNIVVLSVTHLRLCARHSKVINNSARVIDYSGSPLSLYAKESLMSRGEND